MNSAKNSNLLLEYFLLVLFSAFSALILIVSNAPILGVAVVLFLAPLIIMWQRIDMRTRLLVPLSMLALSATVVMQSFAYRQGLWYEITPTNIMMFGTGPLESYVFACFLIVYFIVMYEYFFDDSYSRATRGFQKAMQVGVLGSLLAVSFGYVLISSPAIVNNGFAILVGFLSFSLVALASVRYQLLNKTIFRKAFFFAVAMLPISLLSEFVLLNNNIRIYAHANDYLHSFTFFGHILPLEEVFLLLLLPMWIVVLYELCIDDGK